MRGFNLKRALDFESEKFLTISCPLCFEDLSDLEMIDQKGMLCLHDARLVPLSTLGLWILKDNISSTWVNEYSIDLYNFGLWDIEPYIRAWNDEIIFRHWDTLVFFDLKGNRVRE
ncbi:hypothetical protein BC332_06716 [Capsicum chinense]|nr:hypothetical protein BC332_06716 [Capsicum chinense]